MDERSEKLKEDLHQELLEVKVYFSLIFFLPIIGHFALYNNNK